jgi:hypothetical protein
MKPKSSRKIHLSDFVKTGFTFEESGGNPNAKIRFSLKRGPNTRELKAFEIDISSSQDAYFKSVYRNNLGEGKKSADGLYTGMVILEGKEISFVIVLELEGRGTKFDDAIIQPEDTIRHFDIKTRDFTLADDGFRHHQQTESGLIDKNHYVIALVVGSDSSRKTKKSCTYHQSDKIVMRYNLSPRRPVDYTAEDFISLLDPSLNITGKTAQKLRNRG